jgi:hypothetical protein
LYDRLADGKDDPDEDRLSLRRQALPLAEDQRAEISAKLAGLMLSCPPVPIGASPDPAPGLNHVEHPKKQQQNHGKQHSEQPK